MNGITVCVDYDDLLAITLPRNAKHFDKVVVVTTPQDLRTLEIVASVPNAVAHSTEAFYANGDRFNKGRALEEGFDVLGRDGWILVHDADILFPEHMDFSACWEGNLYNAPRRMLFDPKRWNEQLDWGTCELKHEPNEYPGYFQYFHGSDDALLARPWYATDWKHAGGCDSVFQRRWTGERKSYLPFTVLHLGTDGVNWHGRATPRVDGLPVPNMARNLAEQTAMLRRRKEAHQRGKRWGGK